MKNPKPVVYVVDDEPSICKLLECILKTKGFNVETFPSANSFLSFRDVRHPSCMVLDIYLPDIDGINLYKKILKKNINIPVVFVTGQGDIPMAVKAIKSGAIDFLTKPLDHTAIINAVSRALKKDVEEIEANRTVSEIRQRMSRLTPRESEVLHLVVGGLLNKQIALKLGISIKTVKIHRGRVMHKMQAESIAELVDITRTAGI